MADLSPTARQRALKLQRDLIQRKIASVEAEIALIEGSGNPEPGLFEQENSGLQSLRERLAELKEMAAEVEQSLKSS